MRQLPDGMVYTECSFYIMTCTIHGLTGVLGWSTRNAVSFLACVSDIEVWVVYCSHNAISVLAISMRQAVWAV